LWLNSSQIDELGNWCLKRLAGCQSHKLLGGIHGNPGKQEPPNECLLTGTVTLKEIQWNLLTWRILTLTKNKTGGRRGCKNLQ